MTKGNKYNADSMTTLSGMEHIQKRPSMYIGGTDAAGMFHLFKEAFDNALDEAQNGYAKRVWVTLADDGKSVTVRDDGRGIPVEKNKKTGESALTMALTRLQTGGKFDSKSYSTSAGLHGVGVKATNALSTELIATVWRDGGCWQQKFAKGKPTTAVKPVKVKGPKHGTEITFTPDPAVFKGVGAFDVKQIKSFLSAAAHLCSGLSITFTYKGKVIEYLSKEGLGGYVIELAKKSGVKLQHDPMVFESKDGTVRVGLAWSTWTDEAQNCLQGIVNLSLTPEGGTHVNGFRKAVVNSLRGAVNKVDARPDDLLDNLFAVIAVEVKDPKFKGQTKGALGNSETEKVVYDYLKEFLDEQFTKGKGRKLAKAVCERAKSLKKLHEESKKLRSAANSLSVVKNERGQLPEKLAASARECPANLRELFVVEGQSAGGTAKGARNRFFQEVLPLKGKIVNAARTTVAKTMENDEVQSLVKSIGIKLDLRDSKKNDLSHMRVGRICLLMDADPDGQHISSLVLTFIIERCPQLIEQGYVYIVRSPLFRGVSKDGKKHWFADSIQDLESKSGKKSSSINVSRLKGHGEADEEELAEYAMNPKTRKFIKIILDKGCVKRIKMVMGEDARARKELLGLEVGT
jgi:DNA gyrase subunit B